MNPTQKNFPDRPQAFVRRVITGLASDGRSTILEDQNCPHTMALAGIPTWRLTEVWKTAEMPVNILESQENCGVPIELAPLPNGTTLRFLEFPPDTDWRGNSSSIDAFGSMGASGTAALSAASDKHEMMHQTDTIDYIIIMKGELHAILEETETVLKAGDVLIQRGTNHAWANRSSEPCLMIAVLIDGKRNA